MSEDRALRRLRRKLGIETLWIFILSVLASRDSYAYEIMKDIERIFGFNPGKVLPYVVLRKLEAQGLVESYRVEKRRYYRITEEGRRTLEEGITYISEVLEKLRELSEERVKAPHGETH